ncbi:hypothetical protein DW841_13280 [Hungatella hathewayi]|nr:hypothetical protein DW841_13280 [Hungatella hathewayi]
MMKRGWKRWTAAALTAAMAAGLLAGCGSDKSAQTGSAAETTKNGSTTEAAKEGTLRGTVRKNRYRCHFYTAAPQRR